MLPRQLRAQKNTSKHLAGCWAPSRTCLRLGGDTWPGVLRGSGCEMVSEAAAQLCEQKGLGGAPRGAAFRQRRENWQREQEAGEQPAVGKGAARVPGGRRETEVGFRVQRQPASAQRGL